MEHDKDMWRVGAANEDFHLALNGLLEKKGNVQVMLSQPCEDGTTFVHVQQEYLDAYDRFMKAHTALLESQLHRFMELYEPIPTPPVLKRQ